jgi:hypothetical protein
MDLTEGSETSAKLNLTPGKYPKENIQDSEHGENLKSKIPSRLPNRALIERENQLQGIFTYFLIYLFNSKAI